MSADWQEKLMGEYEAKEEQERRENAARLLENRAIDIRVFTDDLQRLGIPTGENTVVDSTPPDDTRSHLSMSVDGIEFRFSLDTHFGGYRAAVRVRESCPECGRPRLSEPLQTRDDLAYWLLHRNFPGHDCRPGWIENEEGELVSPEGATRESDQQQQMPLSAADRLIAALRDVIAEQNSWEGEP